MSVSGYVLRYPFMNMLGECEQISMGQAIGNHIHTNGRQIVKRNNDMNNTCSSGNEFNDLVIDDMDLIDFVNDRQ